MAIDTATITEQDAPSNMIVRHPDSPRRFQSHINSNSNNHSRRVQGYHAHRDGGNHHHYNPRYSNTNRNKYHNNRQRQTNHRINNSHRRPHHHRSNKGGKASRARRTQARRAEREFKKYSEFLKDQAQQYVIAMDCEMVGVGDNGSMSALARVTIIDWSGQIIFDRCVKPDRPVSDYRTFVSGITKEHLESETTLSLVECRRIVAGILDGKILVGHALENDLLALRMDHPWEMIRDTATFEPFMQARHPSDSTLWPRKLRDLATEHLNRVIQVEGAPHSPVEDALAALDLYKISQPHFEQVMEYRMWATDSSSSSSSDYTEDHAEEDDSEHGWDYYL